MGIPLVYLFFNKYVVIDFSKTFLWHISKVQHVKENDPFLLLFFCRVMQLESDLKEKTLELEM